MACSLHCTRRSHRMNEEPIIYATLPEVMIFQVARTIQDGELVFHGYGSPVPTLAMLLAKRAHAPHMVHIEGATYGINPEPPFLPPTSNDWSLEQGSVMAIGISELFDIAARGDMGRMFLSGVQVDCHGNLNVTAIGDPDSPRVKLPGSGGGCNLSGDVQQITIWPTGHRAPTNKAGKRQFRRRTMSRSPDGLRDIVRQRTKRANASFVSSST